MMLPLLGLVQRFCEFCYFVASECNWPESARLT